MTGGMDREKFDSQPRAAQLIVSATRDNDVYPGHHHKRYS